MDMAAKFQDQLVFHMTGPAHGRGPGAARRGVDAPGALRRLPRSHAAAPRLSAGARGDGRKRTRYAASLTLLVNRVLETLAPRGIEGERLRKHVLRLERELRAMLAAGESGDLSELWAAAAEKLASAADESVAKVLRARGRGDQDRRRAGRLRRAPAVALHDPRLAPRAGAEGGALPRPPRRAPAQALGHPARGLRALRGRAAARRAQGRRRRHARRRLRLRRDVAPRGQERAQGRAARVAPQAHRVGALRHQVAALPRPRSWAQGEAPHEFLFDNVAAAVAAYRDRLPQAVELVKAIAVAELEAEERLRRGRPRPVLRGLRRAARSPPTTSRSSPTTSSASPPTATTRPRTPASWTRCPRGCRSRWWCR